MNGSSGLGLGDVTGAAGGVAIGTVWANVMLNRRQRRLAREAAGYFGPGEKLAAPIPYCSQGGRRVLATGAAMFVLAITATMVCAATTHNGGLIGAVFFGGTCAALLVIMAAACLAKNYSIVLTDQRLLLFRTKGRIRQRLREIQIGVPRGQVSMGTQMRLDGAAVSLRFAPATGLPPICLNGASPGACVMAVQEALGAELTPAVGSTPPGAANQGHSERDAA
jgi:hypothetical protein